MWRREINKYIKQNCAPSWIYLRDNCLYFKCLHILPYIGINNFKKGDADLRFYITTVQDG